MHAARRYAHCGVPQQFSDAEIDAQLEQGEHARQLALCACDHGCRYASEAELQPLFCTHGCTHPACTRPAAAAVALSVRA